jgi:hypothetical protein
MAISLMEPCENDDSVTGGKTFHGRLNFLAQHESCWRGAFVWLPRTVGPTLE